MKQLYNKQYRPPMPVLDVCLYSSVSDSFTASVSAIVDTGSDATLVPLAYLLELAAEETAPGWLVGITGERKLVSLFFVDVHIADRALSGIRVIGDQDSDEIILGRDVLNKLSLFLDGPDTSLVRDNERSISRLRRD